MMPMVVGISECIASANPESVLLTYALGSCIAVMAYDPVARVAGMVHYMLPDSKLDRAKARQNPCMFADTGIAELLRRMRAMGANQKHLVVRIAGGAQMLNHRTMFDVGRRNITAARQLLRREGLTLAAESVGGQVSRSVRFEVASGKAEIRQAVAEIHVWKQRAK